MNPFAPADAPEVDRSALAGDLARGGYLRGSFSHGSARWFQTDLILCRPGVIDRCAGLLARRVDRHTDRLAARGGPAIALATAIGIRTGLTLLMGEADGSGDPVFAGDAFPGARVTLIEDVVLTGRHALESAAALAAAQLTVIGVLGLLNREQSGQFALEQAGLSCSFAFAEGELIA